MPSPVDPSSPTFHLPGSSEVVEIGLLLPTSWVEALVELSKHRRQTVAQILRGLIERELASEDAEHS
jgi:hypothetical protein